MKLIQILLPLSDNEGRRYDGSIMRNLQKRLADRFGGLTAYTRAPAEGWWDSGEAPHTKDDIVVVEVMAEEFDRAWWEALKSELEEALRQEVIVIRAQPLETL